MPEPTGYPDLGALLPRLDAIASLGSDALTTEYTSVLGRKSGVLTAALRSVATLPVEQRKAYGAAVNRLKARFEEAFARRREALDNEGRRRNLAGTDLTMPGRWRWMGAEHPVTRVVDEIVDIFRGIGFTVAVGPEVETDWFNFTALNFPADHPAMDMHDTLYVDAPPVPGERGGRLLLRTHTSPVQIRTLLESPPPVRVVIPGLVYRNDPFDPSHAPAFSQIEGLAVDEGISFVDLKATLVHFAHRFFSRPPGCASGPRSSPSPSLRRRWMSNATCATAVAARPARELGGWRSWAAAWSTRRYSNTRGLTPSGTLGGHSAWGRTGLRCCDTAFRTSGCYMTAI